MSANHDRVPWYRKKGFKGNLTENEKRKLDAFRMLDKHPAASYDDLPEEVQNYINRIELELCDLKQEKIAGTALLASAVGVGLIYLAYLGVAYSTPFSYVFGAILLIVPWFFYRRQWKKNAEEFLPSDDPNRPTDEGIRYEWELEFIVKNKTREDPTSDMKKHE